jgi:hypothetical protein
MTYVIPPEPKDPKPEMIDCTDRPDIIAACEDKASTIKHPDGGWHGGRFLVYRRSLKNWTGVPVEIDV